MEKKLKTIKSRSNLNKLGKEAVKVIVARTQGEGKGVKTFGGNRSTLKKLKDSTKQRRARYKNLSSKTDPDKSNLTYSGKLIDSIRFVLRGLDGILVFVEGGRNKQVAEHVAKNGRSFLTLAKVELNHLAEFYKNLTK